jgi:phosphate transport system substrate-binding protein
MLRSLLALLLLAAPALADPLVLVGSANAAAPVLAALPKMQDAGLELKIETDSNTSQAIYVVGEGKADLALATRAVTAEERAAFSTKRLVETPFAVQLVALVVSKDVWEAGVHKLDKEQMRRIYEGEATNWKEFGGADHPIRFFNPEAGRGSWEMLATWIYGDPRKAPATKTTETVSTDEETRNVVEFNAGAISLLTPLSIDQKGVFALDLVDDQGAALPPDLESFRKSSYPLARQFYLVCAGRPTGVLKRTIDFMLTPDGAAAVRKVGLLPPAAEAK